MTEKTEKKHKDTQLETPVVLSGYNFISEPTPFTKGTPKEEYTLDILLDETVSSHSDFLNELKKIHEANIVHYTQGGSTNSTVRDLNIKAVTEEMKKSLFPEVETDVSHLKVLRLKSQFKPKVIGASGVERVLKKNLPAGAKLRVKGKARSYKNNGAIGTTFYVNLVQLSPMENEEINMEVSPDGFSSPWNE